jgi:hypothetical protein
MVVPIFWKLCSLFVKEEKAVQSPRDELKLYLESGPEPTNNIIE